MRLFLAALFVYVATVTFAFCQTAIRPDQVCPGGVCGTPDVTWGPNAAGTGYVIGTTVPWRLDATNAPAFTSADNAKIVELTYSAGPIASTLPPAFADGGGFTIQTKTQSLTLTASAGQFINGKSTLKIGPYQAVALISRTSNWYAVMSIPQPPAQAGSTVLRDDMTWVAMTGGGVASCTEADNFLTRTTGLDTTHSDAYKTLICGLKNDASGVWAALDALYVFGTQDTTTAKLNLVSTSYSPATLSSTAPTFAADAGYTGNGTSSYIDTTFNPTVGTPHYTRDSAHMMVWVLSNVMSTGSVIEGTYDGTVVSHILPWYTGNIALCNINESSAGGVNVGSSSATGSSICTRTGAAATALYRNGSSLGTASTSSNGTANLSYYVLARHEAAGALSWSTNQVAAASMGGGLNATQAAALHTKVCAFLTTVHFSC